MICQSFSKTYSLKVGIIRCGNIYGPGDFNLKRLIPEVILSSIQNKKFVIRSNGKSTRDYVYVNDVVLVYISLMKKLIRFLDNLPLIKAPAYFLAAVGVVLLILTFIL